MENMYCLNELYYSSSTCRLLDITGSSLRISNATMTRETVSTTGGKGVRVSSDRGGDKNGDRDNFTPLGRIKGAKSFAGGMLQAVPASGINALSTGGGDTRNNVPGSKTVESEGFVPLRKVECCDWCTQAYIQTKPIISLGWVFLGGGS